MAAPRLIAVAFALLLAAAPGAALAEVQFSEIQDVARAKAEEGLALYAEGRWKDAYERFRIAEDLFHAPTLVLHMAHCQRELGHWIAARSLYRKVAEEAIPEGAPEAFQKARDEARARVADLDAAIPRASIDVPGSPDGLVVLLDGGPVVALHPADIELDPGAHHLHAAAKGAEPLDMDIDLKAGERRRVRLDLKPIAPAPPRPPPPPGSLLPGFVALGVGIAGVTAGAVAGGVVMARVGRIKEQCDGSRCPDTLAGDAEAVRPVATVSDVGFVVGGVGLAAGVVLLLVRPGGGDAGAPSVQVGLGPRGPVVRGTF